MERCSTIALRAALFAALFAACEAGGGSPSVGGPGLEPPVSGSGTMSGGGGIGGLTDPSAEPAPTLPSADGNAASGAGSLSDAAATGSDAAPPDAAVDGVSCDRRLLTCRAAEPACPAGESAEIVGNCFGACVPIDACACDEPAACPNELVYTCHMLQQRCGPYL